LHVQIFNLLIVLLGKIWCKGDEIMNKTWKPTTAGILSIVGGILGIVFGGFAVTGGSIAGMLTGFAWMAGVGAGLIVLGIIALIGGIMALKRKTWGFALTGAICSLFPMIPLGVLAIIFVAMGKREFV
jgi:hypothetical protein